MRSSLLWKLEKTQWKMPKRHAPNKARERWNDKGEINKGPTTGNGVGASSLEIRTGNFSKSVTLWTCFWAQTECSAGCDLWSIFFEMLWAEHIVVFWFPLLCGWVPSIHCHLPLSFSGFISLFLKEKHGKKTPLSTFHCNQLQHTRSACFKTDLPDCFRFNFVQVVTEPCGSVALSWRHGDHVTETRDFQLQTTQLLEASCLFSFKSILLRTSGKFQSIKRTAGMLNFIYIVQCKWYLQLKISVQRPFKITVSGTF